MMPATARPLPRSPRRSICGRLMIDSTSPTSAVTGKQHSTSETHESTNPPTAMPLYGGGTMGGGM